jgi:putative ABC transport system ATP-binding protein
MSCAETTSTTTKVGGRSDRGLAAKPVGLDKRPSAATPVLELCDVVKMYRADPGVEVLRKVNLRIAAGDLTAILGSHGAGKTTLLHVLGCLIRPVWGTVYLEGQDVGALMPRERSRVRGRRIGLVPQRSNLMEGLRVLENVAFGLVYHEMPNRERLAVAARVLRSVGHRMQTYPGQLSPPELRRADVARAIVGRPVIVLADEPAAEVLGILRDLHSDGTTVVFTTGDVQLAWSTPVAMELRDGEVRVVDGPKRG